MRQQATIWMIDDNPDVIDITQRAFQLDKLSCQVSGFLDSRALFSALYQNQVLPNLLVVDYYLPDSNGLELVERLSANPKTAGLRIILFSQGMNQAIVAKAQELGVYQITGKPKNFAEWRVFAEELCLAGCFA